MSSLNCSQFAFSKAPILSPRSKACVTSATDTDKDNLAVAALNALKTLGAALSAILWYRRQSTRVCFKNVSNAFIKTDLFRICSVPLIPTIFTP